jgi:glycerophosphoryl diester phosphodiesterase
MAELGVNLGEVLGESNIELAAWTLRDRDPLESTLRRLWEAGTTTVITDVPLAVAELFQAPSRSVAPR